MSLPCGYRDLHTSAITPSKSEYWQKAGIESCDCNLGTHIWNVDILSRVVTGAKCQSLDEFWKCLHISKAFRERRQSLLGPAPLLHSFCFSPTLHTTSHVSLCACSHLRSRQRRKTEHSKWVWETRQIRDKLHCEFLHGSCPVRGTSLGMLGPASNTTVTKWLYTI